MPREHSWEKATFCSNRGSSDRPGIRVLETLVKTYTGQKGEVNMGPATPGLWPSELEIEANYR